MSSDSRTSRAPIPMGSRPRIADRTRATACGVLPLSWAISSSDRVSRPFSSRRDAEYASAASRFGSSAVMYAVSPVYR